MVVHMPDVMETNMNEIISYWLATVNIGKIQSFHTEFPYYILEKRCIDESCR